MLQTADIQKEVKKLSSKKRAQISATFFKTGKGEYGEGDIFAGLTVGQCRAIAQKYIDLSFGEIKKLLKSKIHEERLIALFILVYIFEKSDVKKQKQVYEFYLEHTKYINNWDLVDLSADKIVGVYLFEKDKKVLTQLATSGMLWEERIAIIATYYFIKNNHFQETLQIAKILLHHEHDLIHKAVGWMLREVGKRDLQTEEAFLKKYYKTMPRTMLRYAIEKFPEKKRQAYLKGSI